MMTPPEHDQDSMMALEALLKIKSNNNNNIAIPSLATPPPATAPTTPVTLLPNTTILNLAHHFIPMHIVSAQSPFAPLIKVGAGFEDEGMTPTAPATPTTAEANSCINKETSSSGDSSAGTTRESTPFLKLESDEARITDAVIRQEQIDAALRSKPQRGKKRDNLSVHERLELTRTRNREHAKSTRIRKKARYQELLDKEHLFDDLRALVELEEARISTVRAFINCRNKLLTASCSRRENDDCRTALDNAVHDTSSFTFDGHGPQHADAMIRMDMLEDTIRFQVIKAFGEDAAENLEYRLVGGTDAIAVTRAGVVVVELSIVIKGKPDHDGNDVSIMTALIRWTFASKSDKLTGMQWSTISDSFSQNVPAFNNDLKSVESAKDLLGMQTCYPSVVSLDRGGGGMDPHPQHQQLPPLSPGNSPGMNL